MPNNLQKQKGYTQSINNVLVYIRNNIEKPLKLESLAQIACLSPYHFHRIFLAVVGETLHQHIMRIRMENAAIHLAFTKEPIVNVAGAHGYPRTAAFSKAFKQYFNVSPGEYRASGAVENHVQNTGWNVTENMLVQLTHRTETSDARRVLYVKKFGRYDMAASEAWSELMAFAEGQSLLSEDTEQIGVTYDSPVVTQDECIQYDACISSDVSIRRDAMVGVQTIKGGRFEVFTHVGPCETSWATYNAIYSQWLFESGATLRNAPCFARYWGCSTYDKPQDMRTEIYVPVE